MEKKTCPLCFTALKLQQINFDEAVYFCMDLKCSYPHGYDCIIVQRKLTDKKSVETKPVPQKKTGLDNWIDDLSNSAVDRGEKPTGKKEPCPTVPRRVPIIVKATDKPSSGVPAGSVINNETVPKTEAVQDKSTNWLDDFDLLDDCFNVKSDSHESGITVDNSKTVPSSSVDSDLDDWLDFVSSLN